MDSRIISFLKMPYSRGVVEGGGGLRVAESRLLKFPPNLEELIPPYDFNPDRCNL